MTGAPVLRCGRFAPLVLVAVLFSLALSCGRKTAVRPPNLVSPSTVEGLTASNTNAGIKLGWERPTRRVDGSHMLDLAGFRVERRRVDCGFATIATVDVEDRYKFRRAKRFSHVDERVDPGELYLYRVVAFTVDGYESAPGAPVEILRQIPVDTAPSSPVTP